MVSLKDFMNSSKSRDGASRIADSQLARPCIGRPASFILQFFSELTISPHSTFNWARRSRRCNYIWNISYNIFLMKKEEVGRPWLCTRAHEPESYPRHDLDSKNHKQRRWRCCQNFHNRELGYTAAWAYHIICSGLYANRPVDRKCQPKYP